MLVKCNLVLRILEQYNCMVNVGSVEMVSACTAAKPRKNKRVESDGIRAFEIKIKKTPAIFL